MGGKETNSSWIECIVGILLIQSSHPHRTTAYKSIVLVPLKRDSRFEYLGRRSKSPKSLAMDQIVQLLSTGYKSSA